MIAENPGLTHQDPPAPGHCEFASLTGRDHVRIAWHVVVDELPGGIVVGGVPACRDHAAVARSLGLRVVTRYEWKAMQLRGEVAP